MFVPLGIKVVNKSIIYSDDILSLKEFGENLNVTVIEDVKNNELDECVQGIFKDNIDVVFNTIQYSKKDKKIYVYTSRPININSWSNRDTETFDYCDYDINILKSIKNDLLTVDNYDGSVASLYDVWKAYRNKRNEYETKFSLIEKNISKKIKDNFDDYSLFNIYPDKNFDLEISIWDFNKNIRVIFNKSKNDDIYIREIRCKKKAYIDKSRLLMVIGDEIEKIYELLDERNEWLFDSKFNINNNSSFRSDLILGKIKISIGEVLSLSLSDDSDEVSINSNSNNLLSCIRGNEHELFKKVFVNIEDLPDSIRDEVCEIRKAEIIKNASKKNNNYMSENCFNENRFVYKLKKVFNSFF